MYDLSNLFSKLRAMPTEGYVLLLDGEAYPFISSPLDMKYGTLKQARGLYVIIHKPSLGVYIGTAVNLAVVVSNLRRTLRDGTCPNENLMRLYSESGAAEFSIVAIYSECIKTLVDTSQLLMNKYRSSDQCLNNFFKTKTHGAGELKGDESVYGCYTLTHKPSGYFYVGSAKNPIGRKYAHLHLLRNKQHNNRTLQDMWDRTAEEDWEWSFTIFGNKEATYDHEQSVIDQHFGKTGTLLLNHSNNARDPINALMTPDVRQKQVLGSTTANRALLSQAIVVDGKEYPSATAAAEVLGVSQSTVSRWANNPANPKAYWKDGSRPEFVEGKVRKVNMWRDPESRKARTGSGNPFAKKIIVDNVTYGSVKEAQDAVKVGEKTLRKWANDPTNYRVYWR